MNALEKGLYDKLIASAALVAELITSTAVYNATVPQGTNRAYVVFFYAGGGPMNDSPSDTREYVYAVKGVADESKKAGTIQGLIEAALHRQALTVAGYTNYVMFAGDEISMVETQENGKLIFHCGNFYRIGIDDG